MKIYCVSDNIDTNIGLRLVGINGKVIHEKDKVVEEINRVRKCKDIGIILITRKLAEMVPDLIDELKLSAELPLILKFQIGMLILRKKRSILQNMYRNQ